MKQGEQSRIITTMRTEKLREEACYLIPGGMNLTFSVYFVFCLYIVKRPF